MNYYFILLRLRYKINHAVCKAVLYSIVGLNMINRVLEWSLNLTKTIYCFNQRECSLAVLYASHASFYLMMIKNILNSLVIVQLIVVLANESDAASHQQEEQQSGESDTIF